MSKIKKRRKNAAKIDAENKAVMAKAPIVRREFPYKALLVVILALVAVAACVLLVINAVIDSKMGMFKDEDPTDFNYAVANTVDSSGLYTATADILKASEPFRNGHTSVINNYNSSAVVNLKNDEDQASDPYRHRSKPHLRRRRSAP